MQKPIEKRGGRRANAGRKPFPELILTYSIKLTPAQAKLVKEWGGGNMSAGFRWLVEVAGPSIHKVEGKSSDR